MRYVLLLLSITALVLSCAAARSSTGIIAVWTYREINVSGYLLMCPIPDSTGSNRIMRLPEGSKLTVPVWYDSAGFNRPKGKA